MILSSSQPIISISNLSFSYPDGRAALKDINLTINAGERVAIVGPNGAGKSTLLLHLNGIYSGSGSISISGLELNKHNIKYIRSKVGLVFQNPDDQLFTTSVYEDVAYGPIYQGKNQAEIDSLVKEALDLVQMAEYINRVSYHLSTGEKKRIAIATVLSMKPEILALDEPTAGLDPRSRRLFIELLKSMSLTMIAATHDLDMVKTMFPRSIVMDKGSIVFDGDTYNLLREQKFLCDHGLA